MKSTIFVLIGIVIGITAAMSCGDDLPSNADAAVQCDCPASEPPLNTRLVRATETQAIPAMAIRGADASCLPGYVVISGGCLAGITDSKHVLLSSSPSPADNPSGWGCIFYNGTAAEVTSTATVLCLKPAP